VRELKATHNLASSKLGLIFLRISLTGASQLTYWPAVQRWSAATAPRWGELRRTLVYARSEDQSDKLLVDSNVPVDGMQKVKGGSLARGRATLAAAALGGRWVRTWRGRASQSGRYAKFVRIRALETAFVLATALWGRV
jgi:hypothetical protein